MTRLILFLIRRKLGVKKFDGFRFSNQRSDVDYYYFTKTGLYKVDYGTGEIIPSRVKGDKTLQVRYISLTEEGLKFDPEEDERRKARERLEASAARKEARRLEKEERARKNSVL